MGGSPTTTTTQSGTQSNQPWAPAIPALQNILGQVGQGNYSPTGNQTMAANGLLNAVNKTPNYGAQGSNLTGNLFNYNTQPQQSALTNSYATTLNTLAPYLNPNYTNPMAVPGFANTLAAIGQQTQQNTDSLFSAAGRDPAGNAAAAKAAAIASANAEAPYVTGEFNALAGQQQNALNQLLNSTTGTMGALTQQQAQQFGTGLEGVQLAQGLPGLYAAPEQAALTASGTQAGLPISNLAALEGLTVPIAGLGGTMNYFGTGQTQGPSSTLSNVLGGGLGLLGLGTGGGGTLGGGLLSGLLPFSDIRLKEDIEPLGILSSGVPIYTFRYKGDPETRVGPMAQEVEKMYPEAVVTHPSGFKTVDYGAINNGILGGIL